MLFHCSSRKLTSLLPLSEYVCPKTEANRRVIYASQEKLFSIPFGLTYQFYDSKGRWEFHIRQGRPCLDVYYGSIDYTKSCWLYILPKSNFRRINILEWICEEELPILSMTCLSNQTLKILNINYLNQ